MELHLPIRPLAAQARSVSGFAWEAISGAHSLWRRRRKPRLPPPILVVGSLRSGGSMKTDLVDWLAVRFPRLALLAHPTGDEDRLLASRHPGRVFVRGDLLEAWEEASSRGFRLAVSDGGLQDPALEECPALRMVHPGEPPCRADLLPWGRFRSRRVLRPGPVLELFLERDVRRQLEPSDLPARGTAVRAACAVARPGAFVADLRAGGLDVLEMVALGDHARFPSRLLGRMARDPSSWVVTEKDAHRQELPPGVRVVRARLGLDPRAIGAIDRLVSSSFS